LARPAPAGAAGIRQHRTYPDCQPDIDRSVASFQVGIDASEQALSAYARAARQGLVL